MWRSHVPAGAGLSGTLGKAPGLVPCVSGAVAPQVVMLLTGLSEEKLKRVGGVLFRDPVTERDLPRA